MLREEIGKILCRGCGIPEKERHCNTCCSMPDKINAVCEAIGKVAEGMPKAKNYYDTHDYYAHGESATHIARLAAQDGINGTHATCQAYWQKKLGK